jgi:hypothetical protein
MLPTWDLTLKRGQQQLARPGPSYQPCAPPMDAQYLSIHQQVALASIDFLAPSYLRPLPTTEVFTDGLSMIDALG